MKKLVQQYIEKIGEVQAIKQVLADHGFCAVANPFATNAKIDKVIKDEADEWVALVLDTGETYVAFHEQDCCEHVWVTDYGDIESAVGEYLMQLESVSNEGGEELPDDQGSHTWTFVNVRTDKDTYQLRFYGTSNGCYSEDAQWYRLTNVAPILAEKAIAEMCKVTKFHGTLVEVALVLHERYYQWAVCVREPNTLRASFRIQDNQDPIGVLSLTPFADYSEAVGQYMTVVESFVKMGFPVK